MCLKDYGTDMYLKGNYLSDEFHYIEINFELCHEYSQETGTECTSLEATKDYLDNLYINVAIFK